jgi:hypothetical protein
MGRSGPEETMSSLKDANMFFGTCPESTKAKNNYDKLRGRATVIALANTAGRDPNISTNNIQREQGSPHCIHS